MKTEKWMEAFTQIKNEWIEEFVRTDQAAEQKARKTGRRTVSLGRWMTVAMNVAATAVVVLTGIWLFNQSQKLPELSTGGVGTEDLYPICFETEADWVDYEAALEKIAAERIARNAEWVLEDYDPERDSAAWLDVCLSAYYPWTRWDLLAIEKLRKARSGDSAMLPRYNDEAFKHSQMKWSSNDGVRRAFWLSMYSTAFQSQLGSSVRIDYTYLEPEAYLYPDLKADASMPLKEIVDTLGAAYGKKCSSVRVSLGDRTVDALTRRSGDNGENCIYYFLYDNVLVRISAACGNDALEAWMAALTFQRK
ncbi:MAG: hypothetical protein IJY28_10960 [Clostridia bacterium]|nr:hypothetical protein [Clostridia bacterium]